MPRPILWVRALSVLSSYLTHVASDLLIVLLSALEEQLAASHHETEEAHLWAFLLMEDHERAVVVGIRQGVDIALAAMQLRTCQDFYQVKPRFLAHAMPVK